jgi:hypothetical protein
MVRDWLHDDPKAQKYWDKQAKDRLEEACWSKDVKDKGASINDVAVRKLAIQLQDELVRQAPKQFSGIYHELLMDAFLEVNWTEIAEDLIGQ